MKNKGFTIVETLVAITILMIAVAGPLTVANKALRAAVEAKNQMIAINLAQESMEVLKNMKDNAGSFDFNCSENTACGVGYFNAPFTCGNCSLSTDSYEKNVYKYGGGMDLSPFRRHFIYKTVGSDKLVTVYVGWGVDNEVKLQEIMNTAMR